MRRIAIVPGLMACALVIVGLAACVAPESPGLLVTVVNSSAEPLTGLSLSSGETTKSIPSISGGESVEIRPYPSSGENSLELSDASGRRYVLLGYFEGNPRGSVVVTVKGEDAGGLEGQVDSDTDYPGTDGTHELQVKAP